MGEAENQGCTSRCWGGNGLDPSQGSTSAQEPGPQQGAAEGLSPHDGGALCAGSRVLRSPSASPMSCPRSGCYLAGGTASPPRLLRPSEGGLGVGREGGCLRRVEAWSRPCRGTFWKREEGLASGGVGGLQAALRPQGEWEKRFFPEGLKGKSHIHIPKGTALMSFLFRPGGWLAGPGCRLRSHVSEGVSEVRRGTMRGRGAPPELLTRKKLETARRGLSLPRKQTWHSNGRTIAFLQSRTLLKRRALRCRRRKTWAHRLGEL